MIMYDNIEFLEKDLSNKKVCISAAYNQEWNYDRYETLYSFVLDFLKI